MSRSADSEDSNTDAGWGQARNQLFSMIMEGRSFSGHERNCCFLNTGASQFATISAVSGLDFPDDARCIAVTDWDQDGDQDMWIANRNTPRLRFMRNENSNDNHFLSLQLVGNGTTTSTDSIGARVVVDLGDEASSLVQTLRAGEGFLSQSSKTLHFGLGSENIRHVTVFWPGAKPQKFDQLRANSRYRLVQDELIAEAVPKRNTVSQLTASQPALPEPSRSARITLQSRVPMPSIRYELPTKETVVELFADGKPTIVHLWASWCGPCVEELHDFAAHKDDLEHANVNVISLSVDAIGEQATSPDAVEACIQKLSYPFLWGYIGVRQMDRLQELNDQFFFTRRPLPLPSSFLISADGRLSAIYRGAVSAEKVLEDLANSPAVGYSDTAERAACLPGRSVVHDRVREIAKRTDLQTRHRVATWLEESGQFQEAIEHYTDLATAEPEWALPIRHLAKLHLDQNELEPATQFASRALELSPESARVHNTMGLIESRQGDQETASRYFRKSIELDGNFAGAHNNLGIVSAMQGNLNEAGDLFRRAVELDDDFAKAHTNLGNVYAASSDAKRATFHYQRAIQIDPSDVEPYNNLGTMLGRQGKINQAIQFYRRALQIDPADRNTRKNLQRATEHLNATE